MQILHNFANSLNRERQQTAKADTFYREVLKVSEIKRFNSDNEADMEMQRQDVDLLLTINGITYRISEKFRDVDYGDMYVEVYSKYPNTLGWLHTGKPDIIFYFTPVSVYRITHNTLHTFCFNVLFPALPNPWFKHFFQSKKTIVSKQLNINYKTVKINLISACNFDKTKWVTIGISLPFEVLIENGVQIKRYDLINALHCNTL
jgi:hypothetical protein